MGLPKSLGLDDWPEANYPEANYNTGFSQVYLLESSKLVQRDYIFLQI